MFLATIVVKVNQKLIDIETLTICIKHIDEILMNVYPFQVNNHAKKLPIAQTLIMEILSMEPGYENPSWSSFQMDAMEYQKIMESSIGWMEKIHFLRFALYHVGARNVISSISVWRTNNGMEQ